MITALEAKNFKRHKDLQLSFTDGMNLITGPNYSGKSSILHAILFALGGPRAVPGGKQVVTTRGESGTSVRLTFKTNAGEYIIERKASAASIWLDGELQAKSASAVNKLLEEILGMEVKRFLQLRYAEQKKTEALLTLGAAELHNIIKEVIQVDIVELAIGRCKDIVSETKGALSVLPAGDAKQVRGEVDRLYSELNEKYAELNSINADLSEAQAHLDHEESDLAKANEDNAMVRAMQKQRDTLINDLSKIEAQINELPSESNRAELQQAASIAENNVRALQQDTARAEQRVEQLSTLAGQIETLKLRCADTKTTLDGKLDVLNTEYAGEFDSSADRTILEGLLSEQATGEKLVADMEQSLASSVCPTCQRPYDNDPDHLANLRKDITKVTEINNARKAQIDTYRKQIQSTELMRDSKGKLEVMVASLQDTYQQQEASLAELQGQHAELIQADVGGMLMRLRNELEVATAQFSDFNSRLHKAVEMDTKREQLGIRHKHVSEAIHELPSIGISIDTSGLERRVKELKEKVAERQAASHSVTVTYSRLYEQHASATKRLQDAEEAETTRKTTQRRHDTGTALGKYLKTNRDRFMATAWDGILAYASTFAADSTDGTIEQVVRTDSGSFAYIENGAEHPIEAASGAQRTIMGLGVQLALAQMLPCALPTLLLDEPSSDMDPDRSLAVASLLSAEQSQLLMVSHRELDGAVSSNTINLER